MYTIQWIISMGGPRSDSRPRALTFMGWVTTANDPLGSACESAPNNNALAKVGKDSILEIYFTLDRYRGRFPTKIE